MRSWVSPLHCVIFKEYDQFRSQWLSVHCLLVLETCSIVDPIQKNAQKEISPKAIQSVGSHLSFHIRHSSRNIAKYSHKRQTGWALSKLLNKINQFQLSCNFISSNLLSGRSIFLLISMQYMYFVHILITMWEEHLRHPVWSNRLYHLPLGFPYSFFSIPENSTRRFFLFNYYHSFFLITNFFSCT